MTTNYRTPLPRNLCKYPSLRGSIIEGCGLSPIIPYTEKKEEEQGLLHWRVDNPINFRSW
jgi:hypothetical protein